MICWSCLKEIPESAEFCPYCEAEVVPEPTAEEVGAGVDALASMDPALLRQLCEAAAESASGEEFINRVMVGDCPKCGSSETADCDNDPDIDDPCVGRCLECGQLWCLDCGEFFKDEQATKHDCPFWKDLDDDDLDETD